MTLGLRSVAFGPVMAVVAGDFLTNGVFHGLAFRTEAARGLDRRKNAAAIVGTVTVRAGSRIVFGVVTMLADPGAADGVHAVRTLVRGQRHSLVTGRAFTDAACTTLYILRQHVVVGMGAGIFGVSGAVTGFALQIAMPLAEAIQTEAGCGGVGIGGVAGVGPGFQNACANGTQFALTIVVTGLTVGLLQPTCTRLLADYPHVAMATLAIDRILSVWSFRIAHDATQALGFRSGMALITSRTVLR